MSDRKKKGNASTPKPTCPNMDRRKFLKGIGTGAVAGIVAPAVLPLTGCDPTPPSGGCGQTGGVKQLSIPSPPTGTAPVSIVKKFNIDEMVRTAVELAGGVDEINSGDTVVIKPNLTGANARPGGRVHTNPEVIRAMIRILKEKTTARNITVADASAFGQDTEGHAEEMGLMNVVRAEGVNFVGWQAGPYSRVQCRQADFLDWAFRVPTSIAEGHFDHFINMPVLKNHEMVPMANVQYTCCMKNHVGVLHPSDRTSGGGTGIHTARLGQIVAELSLCVPVHTMNVVDATSVILTNGPAGGGRYVEPSLILASKDRVAADSLAVAVLKYFAKQQNVRPLPNYANRSVWDQASITQGQKVNLGRSRQNIEVVKGGNDWEYNEYEGIIDNWS